MSLDEIINSENFNNDEFLEIFDDLQRTFTEPQNENQTIATIHSNQEDNGKGIPISERSVNVFPNRIILKLGDSYKRRIVRPFNRNTHLVTIKIGSIEENLSEMIRDLFQPDKVYGVYIANDEIRLPFLNLFKSIFNYSVKIYLSNTYCKDIEDTEIQKTLVSEYHDVNHNGIVETENQLKKRYFWPNMKTTITQIINSCEICKQAKYERHPYNLKFSGPLLAKRPFQIIHCDTFSFQGSKFLTIIDLFSRYAQAYLVKDGTGITILNKLRHYFGHHNIPEKLVCDEGREFRNKTFEEFCKLNKIDLHFTTVNNPSSNSPIERFHSTILEKLRVLNIKNPKELPSNLMITAVLIYNQSVHSATGYTPFDLLYGPYERIIEFDIGMTVYETYNEKRRQEILPFYDRVYEKNKDKANKILEKRNENRSDPPDLEEQEIFVERNKPRKTDPLFDKIKVTKQEGNKIIGLTAKNRSTTANIRKVKRLRKPISPLQMDVDNVSEPQPGPSSRQDQ